MSNRAPRVLIVAAIVLTVAGLAWAGDDVWTPVGPAGASQLMALAIDPASPDTLYAGFPGDRGVWKTTDGGVTWENRSAGLPPNHDVLGLAISPVDSNVVFVATSGHHVYKSTNGGTLWTDSSGGISQGPVSGNASIVFHPGAPQTMYVTWNAMGGSLFKSTDGGANWTRHDPVTDVGVTRLVATASNPPALYAALGTEGIYKSIDGALTWNPAVNGLPFAVATGFNKYNTPAIEADPGNADVLYTVSNRDQRVYKTTDGGAQWSVISSSACGFSSLRVQPSTGHVFATGNDYHGAAPTYRDCVFRSTDRGVTFSNLTPTHRNAALIVLHPADAEILYAHMNEGIYKSVDGGANWSPAYGTMRNYDANVAFAPSLPSTWWAGFWGAMGKSTDSGANFTIMTPSESMPYGERFAIHPTDPNTVITAAWNPCLSRLDDAICEDSSLIRTADGGTTWSRVPNPLYPDDNGLKKLWGILHDPADASIVYAVSPDENPGVYKSTDGGQTFSVACGKFGTRLWPNALVAAPTNPTTLYMGTGKWGYFRGIWRSTDQAASWQSNITGLPTNSYVRAIAVHPTMPATLYISVINDSGATGFYVSDDRGDTWTKLAGAGLAAGAPGVSLAIDPVAPNVLYAGVGSSTPPVFIWFDDLFRSTDGGASWLPFSTGLDSKVILNLAIDPADHNHVIAGTRAGLYEITTLPRTLTITPLGTGSGTVTSTPAGISCGATCSAGFAAGTLVTLSAVATSGLFKGWSGEACSGTGSCQVTMDVARSVSATFGLNGPDPEVSLAATPSIATQGQTLSYTATIRNIGTAAATGVMLTAWPPIGAAAVTSSSASQGSCGGSGPVMCTLGTIAAGASATVTINVLPGAFGTLTMQAMVALIADADPFNNTATLSIACRAARSGAIGVNNWTPLLSDGGEVFRFAVDPLSHLTVYAATASGAFKSEDRGAHWSRVFRPFAVAVTPHPTQAGVLYVADRYRQIFKSTDGGSTWPVAGTGIPSLQARNRLGGFVFWPGDPNTLFFFRADSLYKTIDAGVSWTALNAAAPLVGKSISNLVVDPNGSAPLLYLATFGGVFKSVDGGSTWVATNNGLPTNPATKSLAILAGTPATLVALNWSGQVFTSTDGAASWQPRTATPTNIQGLIAPSTGSTIYGLGIDRGGASPTNRFAIWVSTDTGATWSMLKTSYSLSSLAIDPTDASFLFAGMEGVHVSADSGLTWSPSSVGLDAMEFDGVAFRPGIPSTFYAHGSTAGIFKTADGGATLANITGELISPSNGSLIVDPNNTSTVYAAGALQPGSSNPSFFDLIVKSTDGGATWNRIANPDTANAWFLQPWGLVALPTSPTTLYAGSPTEGVFKSVDGGGTFALASSGLPAGIWLTDLVSSDVNGSALYATGELGVYKSTDGATSWVPASTGLPAVQAQRLAVHPTVPATLYAATASGIFKTTNGGSTWTGVNTGWPLGIDGVTPALARAIVIDPVDPEVVYASTIIDNAGLVYTSRNGGASWWLLNGNAGLDVLAVFRLVLDPADHTHLLAAGRGGLWETKLDLRRLTVATAGSGTGTVTSAPGGIACGTSCLFDFAVGGVVTLTAAPDTGFAFKEWTGACAGSGACEVTMDIAKSVTATFGPAIAPGDCDGDGAVNVTDLVYLVNHLFGGGPMAGNADCNGDGSVNVADLFYLMNYLFAEGPAPGA